MLIKTTILFFLIVLIFLSGCSGPANNGVLEVDLIDWESIRANDIAETSEEWGIPKLVPVSSNYYEDSLFVSGDGETIFFMYYPGDLQADMETGNFADDIDIWISQKPFTEKEIHPISEDVWTEGGVMVSGSDIYYMSNKRSLDGITGDTVFYNNIYKNGEKMSFNTEMEEIDPHYCASKDELYFWRTDKPLPEGYQFAEIYVFKNNKVEKLPFPVNTEHIDFQPFLTPDCETLYFTSTRIGNGGIFKSERLGENSWSEPELVITSKFGTGEPTLTDDGQTLFFIQRFISETGKENLDMFYVERVKWIFSNHFLKFLLLFL